MMKVVLLFALLTVSGCDGVRVEVRTGQNVTLPCEYDISKYRRLSVCWGRGVIPSSGCSNQLISTDGSRVTEGSRASSRYQLLGPLGAGVVSLTILNVSEADNGQYGCRVEIPGWFNDAKHHFDLIVTEAAQTSTSWPSQPETTAEQTAATTTAGQLTSTELLPTSSFTSVEAEVTDRSLTVPLLCILLAFVILVSAGGVIIIVRRWKRCSKVPQHQQQLHSRVVFSSTSSTLQLHSQGSAIENIYQIEGGEYEYCP